MKIGVGFLLFSIINGVPRLFVVEELKDKPEIHKKSGMLSFPLETFKESDGGYLQTLHRLFEEEIGITKDQVEIRRLIPNNFYLIPGRCDIATVYGFGLFLGDPKGEFEPIDNDILFAGWYSCEGLIKHPLIRVETAPIIRNFQKHFIREILG